MKVTGNRDSVVQEKETMSSLDSSLVVYALSAWNLDEYECCESDEKLHPINRDHGHKIVIDVS